MNPRVSWEYPGRAIHWGLLGLVFAGVAVAEPSRDRGYLRQEAPGAPWKSVRHPPTEAEQILYKDRVWMMQQENAEESFTTTNASPRGVPGRGGFDPGPSPFGSITPKPLELTDPPPPRPEGFQWTPDNGLRLFFQGSSQTVQSPAPWIGPPKPGDESRNEAAPPASPVPWVKVPVRGGRADVYMPVNYPFQQGLPTAPVSSTTYIQAPSYAQPFYGVGSGTAPDGAPPPPPKDDNGNNN